MNRTSSRWLRTVEFRTAQNTYSGSPEDACSIHLGISANHRIEPNKAELKLLETSLALYG